jgi:hypothetical protein
LPSWIPTGDGIPDWWEDHFGFNKLSAVDGALDTDGDGASNAQEFFAGTDPQSSESHFRNPLSRVRAPAPWLFKIATVSAWVTQSLASGGYAGDATAAIGAG